MRHFQIFDTENKFPDVLLYRDRDIYGKEKVIIMAIGKIDGEIDMFETETVTFETANSAISFIANYTIKAAEDWCTIKKISYS